MAMIILQFGASSLLIIAAGFFLTKFADRISELTGWGRMFVGGLLLAGATSIPELFVDLKSIQLDLPDLAVGDLLGSSLFNLLILATLDFAFPSKFRRTSFSPVFLHHALSAVLAILLTAIIGIGIASRLATSILGVSIFCWFIVLTYLVGIRLIYLEGNRKLAERMEPSSNEKGSAGSARYRAVLVAFIGYFFSGLVIFLVAPYLVHSADELAKVSGLGHTFVGTIFLALATSLPELAATVSAFAMGAPDLALGNIFGSNAFNMILFIPLDAAYPKSLLSSVNVLHAVTALGVIAAMSVVVMGQLYRRTERSRFWEPSSEAVVVVIVAVLFLIYHIRGI